MSTKTYEMAEVIGGKSTFFKLEQGSNKFRIVSPMLNGFEGWNRSGDSAKVFRQAAPFTLKEVKDLGLEGNPKQFFACIVYSYEHEDCLSWTFTQKSIAQEIRNYITDPDWGDPTAYDITVKKSGTGLSTEYNLVFSPPKQLEVDLSDLNYRLENLFDGDDPLDVEDED